MEQQERIERYLYHRMSSNERQAFEADIASNYKLAQAVAFQKDLMLFFETREPALESQLSELGNQYFKEDKKPVSLIRRWWLLPLVVLLLFVGKWLTSSNQQLQPSTSEDSSAFPPKDTLLNRDVLNKDTLLPAIPAKETLPSEKKPSPLPSQKQETESSPRPIASLNKADFTPNPVLENLLNSQYRSDVITKIIFPASDTIFKSDIKTTFKIKGTSSARPPYQLVIYSNRIFDFDHDHPVFRQPLATKDLKGEYLFDFEAIVPFKKGLYYWMIKSSNEEILYLSRFSVK